MQLDNNQIYELKIKEMNKILADTLDIYGVTTYDELNYQQQEHIKMLEHDLWLEAREEVDANIKKVGE